MATLGNVPAEAYTNTVKDSFNGNGSATAFTMSLPTVTNDVRVVVENVIQDPTVAYSVSGTTLTFTSAPPSGTNNVYVVHLGPAVMTTVPPAEIADATTFASSLTVQGAFTSQGIDDNGNATAITIDSSESVLIGKSVDTLATSGTALFANGQIDSSVDGNYVAKFNRKSSDGTIIELRKNTTGIVGSIDTFYGNVMIGKASGAKIAFDNTIIYSTNDAGSTVDNSYDLGSASSRFKDLYLSGGVYLGGTGSANKLDDVETGTWTPTLGGTAVYNIQQGIYTKIGNTVTIHFAIRPSSIGTGSSFNIFGIPFPHLAGYSSGLSISFYDGVSTTTVGVTGEVYNSQIALYPKTTAVTGISNTTAFFQNNARLYASATYITAS